MKRPIAISLSPNTENDDVVLAIKQILSPGKWFDQSEVVKLENEFAKKFGKNYKALAVNSGRSAQYLILKALGVGKGDEVIIQAFTCVAVPNSILWLGAKPVYADIGDTFNINPNDLEKKITKKTKAIIIQNTFGIPADFHAIKKITQKTDTPLIEDCSHSLGAKYKGLLVGTLGDVSFFSFGRDKVLSSVFGGMILCSNEVLYEEIKRERDKLVLPGKFWVFQQLLHPVAFQFILSTYNLGIGKYGLGKAILLTLQTLGLLSKPVYREEILGERPAVFPKKMPAALAFLARNQLKKLDKFNNHRKRIANYYLYELKRMNFVLPTRVKGIIWLRFPILHSAAYDFYEYAKAKGILLGDWYKGVVMPVKDLKIVGYKKGSCPQAEKFAKRIINLPTYPTMSMKDAKKVVNTLKQWQSTK